MADFRHGRNFAVISATKLDRMKLDISSLKQTLDQVRRIIVAHTTQILSMVRRDLIRFGFLARAFGRDFGSQTINLQDHAERLAKDGLKALKRAMPSPRGLPFDESAVVSMDQHILNNERQATAPDGTCLYAVGDVHGRFDLLESLVEKIEEDVANLPEGTTPCFILLGDYIDRGLQSRQVIEFLLSDRVAKLNPVFIAGNHEDALLRFCADPGFGAQWVQYGGAETLFSYGVQVPHHGTPATDERWVECWRDFLDRFPKPHETFFKQLSPSHTSGDFVFVHAGLRPGLPLEQQSAQDMMWIRSEFLNANEEFSHLVVHGHTPSAVPELDSRRLGLDTGAYFSGVLTAARFLQTEIKVIST